MIAKDTSKGHVHVRPDIISGALSEARQTDFETYRRREQAWLRDNLPPIATSLEKTFAFAIRDRGPEFADAILLGGFLGGAIVRSVVEEEQVDTKTCVANVNTYALATKGMKYDEGYDLELAVLIFGEESAQAFEEIRHPAAKEICTVIVGTALKPNAQKQAPIS